ncbi:GntR family transcriptional regulator [Nitratireductor kimnyeongensis]|uniref:GntR family transcriptional regulator n=2 Tax=Nitratireductor kimnyeongensis TaxID=430679 RepID=A0ABW0T8C8_9HYPH|nr:GntR family transcriptional regulator [Nitratireductor kimnyeongensis]QZZ34019.1 GntR family transcriptional regulator [Nitratireductor kimnyeongensis]
MEDARFNKAQNPVIDDATKTATVQRSGAYEGFLKCLMQGVFRPGRLVTQREICDATGSPITAVREALKRLEGEGIVELIAKKGVILREITADEVREIYQLRKLVEVPAVRIYALNHDPEEVATLRRKTMEIINAPMETAEQRQALVQQRTQLDWGLHQTFLRALQSSLVDTIFRNLETRQMLVRLQLPPRYLSHGEAFAEHHEILDAILERAPDKAAQLLADHLDTAKQRFLDAIEY